MKYILVFILGWFIKEIIWWSKGIIHKLMHWYVKRFGYSIALPIFISKLVRIGHMHICDNCTNNLLKRNYKIKLLYKWKKRPWEDKAALGFVYMHDHWQACEVNTYLNIKDDLKRFKKDNELSVYNGLENQFVLEQKKTKALKNIHKNHISIHHYL